LKEDNNISKFDNLFKEQLNNANIPAPPGGWESVASQIGSGASSAASGSAAGSVIGKSVLIKTITGITGAALISYGVISAVNNTSKENTNDSPNIENVIDQNKNSNTDVNTTDATEYFADNGNVQDNNSQVVEHADIETLKNQNEESPATTDVNTNTDNSVTDQSNPIVEDGDIVENNSVQTDNNKPSKIRIADTSLCIGSTLKASCLNGDEITWYLNGVKIGDGQNISYKINRKGILKLELRENGESVDNKNIVVGTPNTRFSIADYQNGKLRLTPSDNKAIVQWKYIGTNNYITTRDNQLPITNYENSVIGVRIIVTDANGCKDSSDQNVNNSYVRQGRNLMIPNTFSPGSDGKNDNYVIAIEHEKLYQLTILDKNRKVVFRSNDKNAVWDGSCDGMDCASGKYYFVFRYQFDGSEKVHSKTGEILLFRPN
jgi:gliding motility-associated-like protein